MRSTVGLEISSGHCSLVRAAVGPGGLRILAFETMYGALEDRLRAARVGGSWPTRARLVVWGIDPADGILNAGDPRGARMSLVPGPELEAVTAPVTHAGFRLTAVTTPARALAALAATRWTGSGRTGLPGAVAWLALNRDASAVAIVGRHADLLYAREFPWEYRDVVEPARRLLNRYLFVSRIAPDLHAAFRAVKDAHGLAVGQVVTCGNLGDLRSFTMPLIEELDAEVETLDTMEGLDPQALPSAGEQFGDEIPSLRLAIAAAVASPALEVRVGESARPARAPGMTPVLVAALALGLVLLWLLAAWRSADPGGEARPPARESRTAAPDQAAAPRGVGGPAADRPETVTVGPAGVAPAAGQAQAAEDLGPAGDPPARRLRPASGPADVVPLPTLQSILFSAERRLAVLDGRLTAEGDVVGGHRLLEIGSDSVVLRTPAGTDVRVPIAKLRQPGVPPGG